MQPIQMVDTRSQYLKIKPEIDKAVLAVMDSSAFINGPAVASFTQNLAAYLHTPHVIPCGNGTDALQIALMALGLQPGDEVIAPSFTFIATIEVIALLKLTPVFVDVDADTYNINIDSFKNAITSKTKAIVPVHLYGQACNMEAIMQVANAHGIYVIEDNAQSIGADYTFSNGTVQKAGTIGHIGCTSFYPSKNLGAFGDGGALCTANASLADKIKMIANHGQGRRYYHDIVGCNSRLDSMQAAILDVKLKYLEEYIAARRAAAAFYDKAFASHPKIITPQKAPYSTHVYHQYTIALQDTDRDALVQYLAGNGIPAMLYYPLPGHRQKMFAQFNVAAKDLPVTDWLTQRVVSLPMHTELTEEQLSYITQHVLEFLK